MLELCDAIGDFAVLAMRVTGMSIASDISTWRTSICTTLVSIAGMDKEHYC